MSRPTFYWIPAKESPPNYQEGTCRYCGKVLTGRQKKWCCEEHSNLFYERYRPHKKYWSEIVEEIKKRDNYQCLRCGETIHLTVHHKTPIYLGGAMWDPNNLETLCKRCHCYKHRTMPGKF